MTDLTRLGDLAGTPFAYSPAPESASIARIAFALLLDACCNGAAPFRSERRALTAIVVEELLAPALRSLIARTIFDHAHARAFTRHEERQHGR